MASKKNTTLSPGLIRRYEELIQTVAGIERKGASLPYTSVNGNMFSFLDKDGMLSLRLSGEDIKVFIDKYATSLSSQHGVVMKEYVLVPAKLLEDTKEIASWFKRSVDYAKTLKPKPSKKK